MHLQPVALKQLLLLQLQVGLLEFLAEVGQFEARGVVGLAEVFVLLSQLLALSPQLFGLLLALVLLALQNGELLDVALLALLERGHLLLQLLHPFLPLLSLQLGSHSFVH